MFDAVALDYRQVTVIADATTTAVPQVHLGELLLHNLIFTFICLNMTVTLILFFNKQTASPIVIRSPFCSCLGMFLSKTDGLLDFGEVCHIMCKGGNILSKEN